MDINGCHKIPTVADLIASYRTTLQEQRYDKKKQVEI